MKTELTPAKRVLFVQGADPSLYPPIFHAATTMAESGWQVTILSTPQSGVGLEMPCHPAIREIRLNARASYRVGGRDYLSYCRAALSTALRLRPNVVYASDPLGAAPGLLVAQACGSVLVYHEHDSPAVKSGSKLVHWARLLAARKANIVIFPNADRARIVRPLLRFKSSALRIVWNLPSIHDLPPAPEKAKTPLIVYYHGSITPERLPESVPAAIARFGGSVLLRIAGYEAPTGKGYVTHLQKRWGRATEGGLIDWIGSLPYKELLAQATKSHIGLALMPMLSRDINMAHMAGASNKAFDYMAAGMPLIVSDLPDWRAMFVENGHALACDPSSADSIEAAIRRLIENPEERERMVAESREKIKRLWNYENAFCPVIAELQILVNKMEIQSNV